MHRCLLVLLALYSANAFADEWIPYTDGRVGGCYSGHGTLYGCTPQPNPVTGQITGDSLHAREMRELSDQNKTLQKNLNDSDEELQRQRDRAAAAEQQLQQARDQQRQDDAAANAAAEQQKEADHQAWLESPEGQAYLKAQDERRKADDAQSQQIHEIFQHDKDLKTCAKREGTINCNDEGCFCENPKKS